MTCRRNVIAVMVLLGGWVNVPTAATAAETGGPACALCETSTSGGGGITGGSGFSEHRFPSNGTLVCTSGGECKDCHAFNACHGGWQNKQCSEFHWTCGQTQAAMTTLEEANNDATLLLVAEHRYGAHLVADPVGSGYVLALDCHGHVVAARRVA